MFNWHGSGTASGVGYPTPCKRTLSGGFWHVYRFADFYGLMNCIPACMGTSAAKGFSGACSWPHSLCRKQGNHGLRGLTARQSWGLVQAIRQREPAWSRYTGGLQVLSALKVSTLPGIIYSLACYSAARQGQTLPNLAVGCGCGFQKVHTSLSEASHLRCDASTTIVLSLIVLVLVEFCVCTFAQCIRLY